MDNPITRKSWSPYLVGAAVGVLSWFAFATADKPLGITTAFENTAALVEKGAIPNFEQANDYYAAKANEGKSPKIDWEWMLVLGVFLGAVSAALWRSSLLRRWIAWTGAAAATLSTAAVLALLWAPASLLLPVGRGLAMLWILATSVALLVGRSGEAMVDAGSPADGRPARPA